MQSVNGAGLAAPQIGVDLQVVISGSDQLNPRRYPDAPVVPRTVLVDPVITPLNTDEEDKLGRLPVGARPARHGAAFHIRYTGFDRSRRPD